MPIKKILKILGFIFLPLIPMVIAVYFLFPYLNEEKHSDVAKKYSKDFSAKSSNPKDPDLSELDDMEGNNLGTNYAAVKEWEDSLQENTKNLKARLDSVHSINDSLRNELIEKNKALDSLRRSLGDGGQIAAANMEVSKEKFSENIKSLLDLDTENLTPIINNMSDEQLVRIFNAGSGLQRKNLLRSLESKRAAKLMSEVL